MSDDERELLPREYILPEAEIVQTEDIDRASMCACKAGDDNPY